MRTLALLLALYITSDFGSACLPGAFAFDPDESVEAIAKVSFSSEAPPSVQNAGAWGVDDRLGDARPLRQLVRPRARLVVIQTVHSTTSHRDAPSPADDDHQL
jgi:hypothetical protein